jgi:glycosyltransferase involved in cell wall biosynthesis
VGDSILSCIYRGAVRIPRVSVIIPAYNAEAHIAETLGSVAGQTYHDWEVVLADDASTDATAELARTFGERFKLIGNARNSGPAEARNLAVAHSSGELLAFLDADDLWLPAFLDLQVKLFDDAQAAGGRVGLVACNARLLGPDGFLPDTYQDHFGFPGNLTLSRLLSFNPIYVSALAPRAVFDEAGGYCPEIFGAEDYDLWVRILELGYSVAATREPLAVYRLSRGSVSTRPDSMARAVQMVYRRALERGKLTPHERRIAQRELRLRRAIERIATPNGISLLRVLRTLPLLARVLLEHPRRWPLYARMLAGRRRGLSPFSV